MAASRKFDCPLCKKESFFTLVGYLLGGTEIYRCPNCGILLSIRKDSERVIFPRGD